METIEAGGPPLPPGAAGALPETGFALPVGGPVAQLHARVEAEFDPRQLFAYRQLPWKERRVQQFSRLFGPLLFALVAGAIILPCL